VADCFLGSSSVQIDSLLNGRCRVVVEHDYRCVCVCAPPPCPATCVALSVYSKICCPRGEHDGRRGGGVASMSVLQAEHCFVRL